jgi:hypothetical protein
MVEFGALNFAMRYYVSGSFLLCDPWASFGDRIPEPGCHETDYSNFESFLRIVYSIDNLADGWKIYD